jgi:hypothetical protein
VPVSAYSAQEFSRSPLRVLDLHLICGRANQRPGAAGRSGAFSGIASTTAIFSVVYAVLLKPLPYSKGNRWVALFGGNPLEDESTHYSALSYADMVAFGERTSSFDVFGWYSLGGNCNLISPGQPQHIDGVEVTRHCWTTWA